MLQLTACLFRQLLAGSLQVTNHFGHFFRSLCHTVNVIDHVQQAGSPFGLHLCQAATGQQPGGIIHNAGTQLFHNIQIGVILVCQFLIPCKHSLGGTQHVQRISCTASDFLGYQIHRGNRLVNQSVIQILGLAGSTCCFVIAPNYRGHNLDHQWNQRQPDQRTDNIKGRMRIRNLSCNHIYFIALGRNKCNECGKGSNQECHNNTAAEVEQAMGQSSAFCRLILSDRCQQCRNGGTDVVTQQNRNGTGQTHDTGHAIRSRLGGEVLQYGNGCRRALNHQCHNGTQYNAQRRNFGYLAHQVGKDCTAGQRLHNTAHDFNAFKQQTEGKDDHADVFHTFLLADKINHKANENNRINIIADFKRHQLCGHRRTDIGTKNNRNCLGQAHESCTDKTNNHDGGGRAALQDSGYQSASQCTHNRVPGQIAEDLLHSRSGCLLQCITHAVHTKQEHGKTAAKAKYRCEYVVHNFLL